MILHGGVFDSIPLGVYPLPISFIAYGEEVRLKKGKLKGVRGQDAVFVIEYMKDFAARRAAEAAGFAPEHGCVLLKKPEIIEAINQIMDERLEDIGIDAEWLMYELVDNHRIARQQGNIAASNTALLTLAKHVSIDALAKTKIEMDVTSGDELLERLRRGRDRLSGTTTVGVSFL